jgi:hypothetical protein
VFHLAIRAGTSWFVGDDEAGIVFGFAGEVVNNFGFDDHATPVIPSLRAVTTLTIEARFAALLLAFPRLGQKWLCASI